MKDHQDVFEVSENVERAVKQNLRHLLEESALEKDLRKRHEEEERKRALRIQNEKRIESEQRLKAERERIKREKKAISLAKRRAGESAITYDY